MIIPQGFLLVDKPSGITSYDCIRVIKRIIGCCLNKTSTRAIRRMGIKIGHSGTLDTLATGLLVIAIGRNATKKLSQIMSLDKVYRAKASIALQTNTLDCTGKVISLSMDACVDQALLEEALASFGSGYVQIPPIFSALKHEGKRLSDHARRDSGEIDVNHIAQTKERFVSLYRCEIVAEGEKEFHLSAHVSHGTYIRTLADDIAQKAGYAGACTLELRRLSIGRFSVEESTHLDSISSDNISDLIVHYQEYQEGK